LFLIDTTKTIDGVKYDLYSEDGVYKKLCSCWGSILMKKKEDMKYYLFFVGLIVVIALDLYLSSIGW